MFRNLVPCIKSTTWSMSAREPAAAAGARRGYMAANAETAFERAAIMNESCGCQHYQKRGMTHIYLLKFC